MAWDNKQSSCRYRHTWSLGFKNFFNRTIPDLRYCNGATSLESSLSRLFSLLSSSKERFNLMEHLFSLMHISNRAAPESDPTDPELHELLLGSRDFDSWTGVTIWRGESKDFGGWTGVTIWSCDLLLLTGGEDEQGPSFWHSKDLS